MSVNYNKINNLDFKWMHYDIENVEVDAVFNFKVAGISVVSKWPS